MLTRARANKNQNSSKQQLTNNKLTIDCYYKRQDNTTLEETLLLPLHETKTKQVYRTILVLRSRDEISGTVVSREVKAKKISC